LERGEQGLPAVTANEARKVQWNKKDLKELTQYDETSWQRFGLFLARHKAMRKRAQFYTPSLAIGTPHWLPTILLAGLPLVRLIRRLRHERAARLGLCPVCNYDLRATPERCPECGAIPENVNA